MREWCVVSYQPRGMMDIRYGAGNRTTVGYYALHMTGLALGEGNIRQVDPYSDPLSQGVQLRFVESEAEADLLIVELAKTNPGYEYGKARVSTVAVIPVTEPVMSKYTEKGLLPL